MEIGDVVGVVILLLIVVGSLVKKAVEAAGQAGAQQAGQKGAFEASASQIADFLRGLDGQRQAKPAAVAAPEEGPRGPSLRSDVAARRARGAVLPAAPEAAAPTERRRRARRPARPRLQPAETARSETVQTVAGVGLPAAGRHGLRAAVVWSEVLGRPVSLRRSHRHRPPSLER